MSNSIKVGILTFHYSCNYGGVLQAYALKETIKSLGYDVEIVNCFPKTYHTGRWKSYVPRHVSFYELKKRYIQCRHSKKIRVKFDQFRKKNLALKDFFDTNEIYKINDKYDVLIVGSDQVWNKFEQTKNIYFLDWEPLFIGLRVSYAVCCGAYDFEISDKVKKALGLFNAISVRNQATYDFVKDAIGIEPPIVADPTILHPFIEFVNTDSPCKENYILTYVLDKDIKGSNKVAINKLKKIYPNCKVIAITTVYDNPVVVNWADDVIYDLAPNEWVDYIAHCKCLYTDSFHGVIFALKYSIPVVAYYANEFRSKRFIDLATRYGISNNIITEANQLDKRSSASLEIRATVMKTLEKQKNDSIGFLKDVLTGKYNL